MRFDLAEISNTSCIDARHVRRRDSRRFRKAFAFQQPPHPHPRIGDFATANATHLWFGRSRHESSWEFLNTLTFSRVSLEGVKQQSRIEISWDLETYASADPLMRCADRCGGSLATLGFDPQVPTGCCDNARVFEGPLSGNQQINQLEPPFRLPSARLLGSPSNMYVLYAYVSGSRLTICFSLYFFSLPGRLMALMVSFSHRTEPFVTTNLADDLRETSYHRHPS
jgi:hypothetical protein